MKKKIALIGGGIMNATLGSLLKILDSEISIFIYEKLNSIALESSEAWNNAGTGHSAFCELNYTPKNADGKIDISKAIIIAEQFEISKQFWSYLIQEKIVQDPTSFINSIPHCSLVMNSDDKAFLKERFDLLSCEPLFKGMQYSESWKEMQEWFPLIMNDRSENDGLAATKMNIGCDINFGQLSNYLFSYLNSFNDGGLFVGHELIDLTQNLDTTWELTIASHEGETIYQRVDFVFIGAGGGSLELLNKSGIDEIDGFGGFPISGKWLKCQNQQIKRQHHAKVYGLAAIGAPPMSVPHLDTRIINGNKELLFGPYAGFSSKFLKQGSTWDWLESFDMDNFIPMIQVGLDNIPLSQYLIRQIRMSFQEKFEELVKFYPDAQLEDWVLKEAGQRVQIIKKDHDGHGILEFGTELIIHHDHSIAGLLGASPGASTAVSIMLNLIEKCFPEQWLRTEWQSKLNQVFISFGKKLNDDEELLSIVRAYCSKTLTLSN